MSGSDQEFDVVVLGFGKAGKTVAMARAKAGDRVALIEKSPDMYGGTCINVGCVPTKALLTDAHLHASARTAAAAGDVNGGPQFTYVSYDDHRVITSAVWGDGSRTTSGRIIPNTTFITPPLSQVGRSEDAAREDAERRGHTLDVRVMNIADIPIMPRPKILDEPEGLAKFLIDSEDDRILGCTLYCVDSQELINLVTLAMTQSIPASALGSAIYTHPSSSEVFNALLA